MTVRTRFAPSPTGVLHLGSVRTALFSWLFARHHEGAFVLRIEDTDRARSTLENVDGILDGLAWLGLDHDEGPFFQTQRFERYREIVDRWLEEGHAYRCYCSTARLQELRDQQMASGARVRYDGRCRDGTANSQRDTDYVVRFRNPLQGEVVVHDAVRGSVIFDNAQLDDLIISRSDGTPTYNLTVIVDDYDMQITHVIRGDDHLNNTPRQLNMLAALGAPTPVYAHLPMILGRDGAKLSKRHGAVDIREYREQGYLPEAMLNYLVRLGWSHGDQEIFGVDDMVAIFAIVDVNQSASAFNPEKLRWINQQHIMSTPADALGEALRPFLEKAGLDSSAGPDVAQLAEAYHERAETLVQMAESARYCYEDFEVIDLKAFKKHLRPVVLTPLRAAKDALANITDWSKENIARTIKDVAAAYELNLGKLGQPIRVAVTGAAVSPPIDVTVWLIGQERVGERLDRAIEQIEKRAITAAD